MLTYAINGSAVTITTSDTIVSGSIGFPLRLTFDNSWNGRYKILVVQFRNTKALKKDKAAYADDCEFVTLDKALGGINSSTIDTEITDRIPFPGGKFRIGVYGTVSDAQGNVTRATPTIWSPYLSIGEGSEPRGIAFKPAPKLIEQIYNLAQSVRDDADNGEFDGEDGVDGKSPYINTTNTHWMAWNGSAWVDTGVYSGGQAPSIGANNHWYVGGVDTGVTALGQDGEDGEDGAPGPQGPQGPAGQPGTTTWAGITDKPSSFPPSSHNHDDRYYTEVEIDQKFVGVPFKIGINYDPQTFKFRVYLCDKYYNELATSQTVDLPIELKQNITDNSLLTTNKTIVGAINELYSMLTN